MSTFNTTLFDPVTLLAGFQHVPTVAALPEKKYSNQLQKWLECQDFILSGKAHSLGMLPVNVNSLRHFDAVAQDAFSLPHYENKMIIDELNPAFISIFKASGTIESAGKKIGEKTETPLAKLRQVSPHDKREVLRYAQIIPTAIAAAYVGVSEHALKEWASRSAVFGRTYAYAHSYSMAELNIIANNRFWIYSEVLNCAPRSTIPDEKALDEIIMVDYDIAAAFTGLSNADLLKQVPPNQLYNRPFRLSDLEKIRVANLTAQQQ